MGCLKLKNLRIGDHYDLRYFRGGLVQPVFQPVLYEADASIYSKYKIKLFYIGVPILLD